MIQREAIDLQQARPGWRLAPCKTLRCVGPESTWLKIEADVKAQFPTARLRWMEEKHRHLHGREFTTGPEIICRTWPRCPKFEYKGPVMEDTWNGLTIVMEMKR